MNAAVRMTAALNALGLGLMDEAAAARRVQGDDVAHHVVDAEALLGLDPLRATPLADAMGVLPRGRWLLALPRPGAPGFLRGPVELTRCALEQGAAVIHAEGGRAVVPFPVGPAVQWRVLAAERPASPPTLYEAERTLNEAVLSVGVALNALAQPAGSRPSVRDGESLGPAYQRRNSLAADKATRMLDAAAAGLAGEAELLSSHAVQQRFRALRALEAAAYDLLSAAASWPVGGYENA